MPLGCFSKRRREKKSGELWEGSAAWDQAGEGLLLRGETRPCLQNGTARETQKMNTKERERETERQAVFLLCLLPVMRPESLGAKVEVGFLGLERKPLPILSSS